MAIKKKFFTLLLAFFFLTAISYLFLTSASTHLNESTASGESLHSPSEDISLASPGRIEGASETIEVSAGVDGILEDVLVNEGDEVSSGQVLARISCEDIKQAEDAAAAELESAKQTRDRLIIGSRAEERLIAAHEADAAKAVMEESEKKYEKMERLYEQKIVSEDDLLESTEARQVAQARYQASIQKLNLVNAPPLPTELEKANADVRASEARKASLNERFQKCSVKSPLSGTILRRQLEPGEAVSIAFPRPIVTLANTKTRKVRAEVDERDIELVHEGQKVFVTSDAFSGKKIQGIVQKKGIFMGRKHVLTGNPGEKSDRDILEVMVELEDSKMSLPIGLRVTVQFLNP